jgi:hypothetical protein
VFVEASSRYDPEAAREYVEHYRTVDPWIEAGPEQELFRAGVVELGSRVVPRSTLNRTAFWSDFGRRYGIRGGLAAVISTDSQVTAGLGLNDAREDAGLDETDFSVIRALLPHLQRAFQIHRRLAGLDLQLAASLDVMDRLALGVLFVEDGGRVEWMNQAARQVVT